MTWDTNFDRKIVLDDGTEIYGYGFGASITKTAEIVFNTSVVGYQEILSDPSYTDQAVVMTYPLIGNYGVNSEDNESARPWAEAFIVRHLSRRGSNFRCEGTLDEYLKALASRRDVNKKAEARLKSVLSDAELAKYYVADERFRREQVHRLHHGPRPDFDRRSL